MFLTNVFIQAISCFARPTFLFHFINILEIAYCESRLNTVGSLHYRWPWHFEFFTHILYLENITWWRENMKLIFEWKKKIHKWVQRTSEDFFPREDKLHIFKPTCNFLFITYSRYQCVDISVSKIKKKKKTKNKGKTKERRKRYLH